MPAIRVEICSPDVDIVESWCALAQRAAGNVFMHPVAVRTAFAARYAKIHLLLAWNHGEDGERLVGVWALQQKRVLKMGPSILAVPPYDYALVSNPVLDPDCAEEVALAFLGAIEARSSLPSVIRMRYIDADSASGRAMLRALASRGSARMTLSERVRPFATREGAQKRSGSTRKKLRQDWNRLGALGSVDIVNDRAPAAVKEAFEVFLELEAESWKGERGTALLSHPRDAGFARELVGNLAAAECASVALLRLDGRPIAAQVLFYCGEMAYTWKTAFDAAFGKYSPGAVLVDKVTEQLFSTANIEAIESCSPEGGFMGQIWAGRRATVDLLVDVSEQRSPVFMFEAVLETTRARLRRLWNVLRSSRQESKRPAQAAPQPPRGAAIALPLTGVDTGSPKQAQGT